LAAESPEAKQKACAAEERMKMRGRKPGWSLLLNPSPAVLEESGCTSADVLRRMIEARERMAIGDYYRDLDDGTQATNTTYRRPVSWVCRMWRYL
jgi:hypothetical protein